MQLSTFLLILFITVSWPWSPEKSDRWVLTRVSQAGQLDFTFSPNEERGRNGTSSRVTRGESWDKESTWYNAVSGINVLACLWMQLLAHICRAPVKPSVFCLAATCQNRNLIPHFSFLSTVKQTLFQMHMLHESSKITAHSIIYFVPAWSTNFDGKKYCSPTSFYFFRG